MRIVHVYSKISLAVNPPPPYKQKVELVRDIRSWRTTMTTTTSWTGRETYNYAGRDD